MKQPGNFHQIAGSSTPGHPPTTQRTTPKPTGIPIQNPRKNIPHVALSNPGAGIASFGNALARIFGRR